MISDAGPPPLQRTFLVTGTDTGVGKTHVTTLAIRSLRGETSVPELEPWLAGCRGETSGRPVVGAYKPVCSGADVDADGRPRWEDVERLHAALGGAFPRERITPQCFGPPLAPPVAAAMEGGRVDPELMRDGLAWWHGRVGTLLVEGVGGLLCPLTDELTVADFAVELAVPLIVVARAGLGTINHTLLTLEASRTRGLDVAAVVLNHTEPATDDASIATNAHEISRWGDVAVLGPLPWVGR